MLYIVLVIMIIIGLIQYLFCIKVDSIYIKLIPTYIYALLILLFAYAELTNRGGWIDFSGVGIFLAVIVTILFGLPIAIAWFIYSKLHSF